MNNNEIRDVGKDECTRKEEFLDVVEVRDIIRNEFGAEI